MADCLGIGVETNGYLSCMYWTRLVDDNSSKLFLVMSAPSICRACGHVIDPPTGLHVCDECAKQAELIIEHQNWLASDASQVELKPYDPAFIRAVDAKIAECIQRKLAQLPKEPSPDYRLGYFACVAFWILAIGFSAVLIVWGVRQLL